MNVKKCDKCGFDINPNDEFTIINGSETIDYCSEECLGLALTAFLLASGSLHLDKIDERTYAF